MSIPGEGTEGERLRGRTLTDLRKLCGRRWEFGKRRGWGARRQRWEPGWGAQCVRLKSPTAPGGCRRLWGRFHREGTEQVWFWKALPGCCRSYSTGCRGGLGQSGSFYRSQGERAVAWTRSQGGKPPVGLEEGLWLGHLGAGAVLKQGHRPRRGPGRREGQC